MKFMDKCKLESGTYVITTNRVDSTKVVDYIKSFDIHNPHNFIGINHNGYYGISLYNELDSKNRTDSSIGFWNNSITFDEFESLINQKEENNYEIY